MHMRHTCYTGHNRRGQRFPVDSAAWCQWQLPVPHTPLSQAAMAGSAAQANDLFKCVIWSVTFDSASLEWVVGGRVREREQREVNRG